jgi:uncharacterized protein (DUF736 family)
MSQGQADQQTFNNELRGALFRNDKGDNPARPDYRGNCEIAGQKYKISAWMRKAQSGQTFMSLAFTATDPPPAPATPATAEADIDDLPF